MMALSLLLLAGAALAGCGGGSGGDTGGTELNGPFLIDFESFTSDDTPEVEPFAVGPNVTMASLSNLIIWSNTKGWAVTEDGLCNATFMGEYGIGSDDATDNHTILINFATPVATVEFLVAAAVGTTITCESRNAAGGVLETIPVGAPACPSPMTLIRFGLGATSNTISSIRINGNVPVIDNLTWYQFQ
jgi:hypothetical protein